jgi:small-conductance mechanosensitive channel
MENWISQAAPAIRAAASKIATAAVIMFLFWLAAAIVYRVIVRVESHLPSRRAVLQLIARSVNIALLILGALTALGTAGINVSALVAGLGLSGFALGFALRDILSNVLAGFLILFYRPFSAGDLINVLGLEGRVVDIDLRYTKLDSGDKIFLIPNSSLFTNPITVLGSRP